MPNNREIPHGFEWKKVYVDADIRTIEVSSSDEISFRQLSALQWVTLVLFDRAHPAHLFFIGVAYKPGKASIRILIIV